jgi:phosphoglycolate phosphatase
VPMAGRTDHAISLAILEREGVEDGEAHLPEMFAALHDALAARSQLIAAEGWAMPGTHEAIEAIAARGGVQTLLTGNIQANAPVKLSPFELDRLLDLDIGAYATDSGVRSELVAVARAKAGAKLGAEVAIEDTVVIGDTPLDVEAAKVDGARVVAVATGAYSVPDLQATEADVVLEDLRDTGSVLNAVDL